MNAGKRLFQYATYFKKTIIFALIMLAIAVGLELTGPFIAKKMIDTHILGIEFSWYETSNTKDAVFYKDRWYKREDRFFEEESRGKKVRIIQADRRFYFVEDEFRFDGTRSIEGNQLVITRGEERAVFPVEVLSNEEVFQFYQPEIKPLLYLMGIYLTLIVFASIFQYGQRYLLQSSANRIIQRMRKDVFAQIHRLPIKYFDNLPAGKVVSRITNDTEAIRELYVNVLANFFTGIIYIIGIFIALFLLNMQLALLGLFLFPILAVWIIIYRKFASKYNHVIRTRLSDINGMINETIQGITIIHAFRRHKETMEEFEELNEDHFQHRKKMLHLDSLTSHNLVGVLRNITFVLLIWYFGGASLKIEGVISIGVLYAFVDYINRLFQPITGIVNQLANLEQALVAGERVFQLLDEEGVDVAEGETKRYRGNVRFENVSFAYKDQDYVLKNISFEAAQGETVALVGHTGSGKSSIMNLLFRFYDVQQGRITIDGIAIKDISRQHLREHMGIVLQDPFLFTGTLASNVSLDEPSISRAQIEQALEDVGATQILRHLPQGIDEPVLEKGSTLSSGQRQLISFARALAFNPAILILDEATSSVDTETEAIIQNALEVLKKGRTTFIIAHRLSTIKNADQIIVLDHGKIVERGSHDQLMEFKGKYYQMYQLQQGEASPSVGPPGSVARAVY